MKILHVVPSYIPAYRYGGPIVSVHTLNKWLVRIGADVTVYTTDLDGRKRLNVPLNREVLVDGVKVHYFPTTFAPWEYSRAMCRALRRNLNEFDIVHITSVFLSASTLGAYYARKYRKPYIISPRGSLMLEPLRRKNGFLKKLYIICIEKRNLSRAAAIHFTAEAEKKEYLEAGLPIRSSFIVPNAFEPEEPNEKPTEEKFRKKYGIPTHKKIILFMGRLNWKKGLDTLIPAFKQVLEEEPETFLLLAGDDDGYKNDAKGLIDVCGLKEGADVVFTGMLLGGDKAAAFEMASIFVLPSYSENFGMVVVEAMHARLPVVITPDVGIALEVKRAGAGLVVPKDEKAVAGAILQLFTHEREAALMGEAGRRLVEREFVPARVAERFTELYNQIAKT